MSRETKGRLAMKRENNEKSNTELIVDVRMMLQITELDLSRQTLGPTLLKRTKTIIFLLSLYLKRMNPKPGYCTVSGQR